MPKTCKYSTLEDDKRRFSNTIRIYARESGGIERIAVAAGRCQATIYNRLNDPDNLTVHDLRSVRRASGIQKEDFMALLAKIV